MCTFLQHDGVACVVEQRRKQRHVLEEPASVVLDAVKAKVDGGFHIATVVLDALRTPGPYQSNEVYFFILDSRRVLRPAVVGAGSKTHLKSSLWRHFKQGRNATLVVPHWPASRVSLHMPAVSSIKYQINGR